jgi:hypothetical protein
MAWSTSNVERSYVNDKFNETANLPFTDTWKLALFNNTVVPDKDATSANSRYGTPATWVTGNEITDATNWVAGGKAITGLAGTTPASGVYMVDCNDIPSGGNVTLTGFFGGLVYDDSATTPVAKQAMSHHYFGGTQTVTANPFTAVVDTNGLWRATV